MIKVQKLPLITITEKKKENLHGKDLD